MPEESGRAGGTTFEATYAENAQLLAFIARVRYRIPAADAEALVHDVFIKFARDCADVRVPRSWLTAAISNASSNYWRDRKREAPLPADATSWPDPIAAEATDRILTRLAVGATLLQLGARCKDVLRRFYVEGESTQTIADALGTSPGYIQLRLHLCRKRARAMYAKLTTIHS